MQCPKCEAPAPSGHRFCQECGHQLPPPPSTSLQPIGVGESIGPYTVLAVTPSDQANRYVATDGNSRTVWIKEGAPDALNREVEALRAISHPCLTAVVDRLQIGARHLLVTTGPPQALPLDQSPPLDTDQVLSLTRSLCEIATAWHQAGFVFGGFAPSRLYYRPDSDQAWLAEAGGAVRLGTGLLGDAMAPGAAPEIMAGSPPTAAADVYGIAATAYALLCRASGSVASPQEEGHGENGRPPLSHRRPDLPPDLCAAIDQAVSPTPSERFFTVAAFIGALEATLAPYGLEVGSCTDRGSVRANNEDCLYTATFNCAGVNWPRSEAGIYVCCDGMGGEAAGEVASSLAAGKVGRSLSTFLATALAQGEPPDPSAVEGALTAAVTEANRAVRDRMRENPVLFGMGTTVTAVAVCDGVGSIIHVGDSRAYRWEAETGLQQLTEDHTVVGQMVAAGSITAEEAWSRPDRNLLWQAVGSRERLEPFVGRVDLRPGQRLLLVSDGIPDVLQAAQLQAIAALPIPAQAMANRVVNTAIAHGSDDNCSAIVIHVVNRLW